MRQSILCWKQGLLCLIMILFMGGGIAYGEEEADSAPSSNSQHMSEIIDVLSGFAGKKSGDKAAKNPAEAIKVTDLKSAIQILQTKKDREQVIKVLSALTYIQAENEKKQSLPGQFTDSVTSIIDTASEVLLNGLRLITKVPESFSQIIHGFSEEESRKVLIDIVLAALLAFGVGTAVESVVRFCMAKFGFHRPKTYTLYNLFHHISRNILPVILFGISAYSIVFYYPKAAGEVLEKSFMWVTAIIMIRTSFMVLRVLFASRHMRATEKGRQSYISSYQFAVAIAQVLITGIIFAKLGMILGAGDQIYQVWLKILSFGVTSLLIFAIWKVRFWGMAKFEFEDENCSNLSLAGIKFVQLLGQYWHIFISFALLLSFFLYFIGMSDHSLFVASATVLTVGLASVTLWLRNMLKKLYGWLERKVEENDGLFSSLSRQPRIALINFLQILLHVTFIVLLFQTWGADPLGLISSKSVHPYLASVISIGLIIALIRLLWIWINYIATGHIQPKMINGRKVEPSLFAKTIVPILQSICHWVLAITGIVLILEEAGIPIMPIIYGVSVIGIPLSLGAQGLVKGLINGILTLMEGNITVGDTVVIGSYTGVVESLSLRGLSLRHPNGALQTIPFSEISSIINKSRDYTALTIEIPFPYETEITKIREVLQSAYNDTIADPFFQKMVIDPVSISGVDRFTEAGFVVMGAIRIKPDPKNRFIRAFNQKLKPYLETEKITPPASPQTIIVNKSDAIITAEEKIKGS